MKRVIINTVKAPKAIGPYNQAVVTGNTMYVSGQIGFNPQTMDIVGGGVEAETHQALKNLGTILREAGGDYKSVVKTTVLLANMRDFDVCNNVYKTYFTENQPARMAYQVAALPKGALVEIDAIAVLD